MTLPLFILFQGYTLTAHNLANGGVEMLDIKSSDKTLQIPEPELSAMLCSKSQGRDLHVCRILITGADDASHLIQHGGMSLKLY